MSHASMASHASTMPLADLAVRILGLYKIIGRSVRGACLPAPTQSCRQEKSTALPEAACSSAVHDGVVRRTPVEVAPVVHADEVRQLEELRRELLRDFGEMAPARLNAMFDAVVAGFETAPIRTFVPVLVRRRLRLDLSHEPSVT